MCRSLETVDLNGVVADMLKMLRRLIGEHIELILKPAYKPQMVHADPGQMEQVVMNLCVNARDAMPDGGRITIETSGVTLDDAFCSAHPWSQPGQYVLLSVSDTGAGIPLELQEHIFEPFHTTRVRGTGLGLAVARRIVALHGGTIAVRNHPQGGAVFKVSLPRVES